MNESKKYKLQLIDDFLKGTIDEDQTKEIERLVGGSSLWQRTFDEAVTQRAREILQNKYNNSDVSDTTDICVK